MTEFGALLLVFAGTILLTAVAILGLAVVHANGAALSLGAIVPLVVGSHLCSRVVVHFGATGKRQR